MRLSALTVLISVALLAACANTRGAGPGKAEPELASEAGRAPSLKQVEGQRMICRVEPVTGTRLNRKVCLTAEQWEQLEAEGKRFLETIQRNSNRH